MVVIRSHPDKIKNEIISSEAVKVLACRKVDFNFLGNFTCAGYLFV